PRDPVDRRRHLPVAGSRLGEDPRRRHRGHPHGRPVRVHLVVSRVGHHHDRPRRPHPLRAARTRARDRGGVSPPEATTPEPEATPTSEPEATTASEPKAAAPKSTHRVRRTFAWILLVLAALLVGIGTVAVWASRTIVNEDRFTALASSVVSDPGVISATS